MPTVVCPGCGHLGTASADGRCTRCGCAVPPPAAETVTVVQPGEPAGQTVTHIDGPAGPPAVPRRIASIPGYEIDRELGRGGMGVVYRAREVNLNRPVALKVLLAGSHAGDRELTRFRAEATAAAAVRHPNVVPVYAVGQHAGLPFIALELVEGGSLDARLAAEPLSPAEAARVVQDIARGVQAAHDQGVVHRDLKPANVLFGPDGEPKVADFGLAKQGESGLTASGAIMGTPAYMAPEQARGDTRAAGPAADVWALGAVLYECLAGRPPFRGQSAPETLRLVCEAEPAPPRRIDARVPRDLETVALKCLEKDPARRYPSAAAVADDLGRYLAGEPVTARPRGPAARLARWIGRDRGAVYAAVGALLTAAVSLIVLAVLPRPAPPTPPPAPAAGLPLDLQLVPTDALGFLTVRLAEVRDRPELIKLAIQLAALGDEALATPDQIEQHAEQLLGLRPMDVERLTLMVRNADSFTGGNIPDFLIVVRTRAPVNLKPAREALEALFGTLEALDHRGRRLHAARSERTPLALFRAGERELAFGRTTEVRAAIDRLEDGTADGPLSPALAVAAEGHTAVLGGRPAGLVRLARMALPKGSTALPAALTRALDRLGDAEAATVTLDLLPPASDVPLPGLDATTRVRFPTEGQAAEGLAAIRDAARRFGEPAARTSSTGPEALLPAIRRAAREAEVRPEGSDVVLEFRPRWTAADLVAAGKPVVPTTEQQLRQVGLALHNYASVHERFPPAVIRAPDGKPLYSWRVELLPYLNEDQLYRRLNLKEPWDSDHNRPLLLRAPRAFALSPEPDVTAAGTRIQVVTGKGGVFDGSPVRFQDITDGTSNTVLAVEAGDPVHWAEPKDVAFDPGRPLPRLGGPGGATFLALMGDASVRPIPRTIRPDVFAALVTRSGGELVDWTTWTVSRKGRKDK